MWEGRRVPSVSTAGNRCFCPRGGAPGRLQSVQVNGLRPARRGLSGGPQLRCQEGHQHSLVRETAEVGLRAATGLWQIGLGSRQGERMVISDKKGKSAEGGSLGVSAEDLGEGGLSPPGRRQGCGPAAVRCWGGVRGCLWTTVSLTAALGHFLEMFPGQKEAQAQTPPEPASTQPAQGTVVVSFGAQHPPGPQGLRMGLRGASPRRPAGRRRDCTGAATEPPCSGPGAMPTRSLRGPSPHQPACCFLPARVP